MTMKRIAMLGLFTAVAAICGYIESLFPIFAGIPGIKLGLANLSILLLLLRNGLKDALLVSLARILIIGFLFGNLFSIVYSAAGAVASMLVMTAVHRHTEFSPIGISVCGGITHNLAQLSIALWLLHTPALLSYLPALLIAGVLTGLLIGTLTMEMDRRLPKFSDGL